MVIGLEVLVIEVLKYHFSYSFQYMKYYQAYGKILAELWLREFSTEEARKIIGEPNLSLLLHRMCEKGLLERVARGVFRAIHPTVLALEWAGMEWRSKIPQKEYRQLMEFILARLIENFQEKLVSIVLFGSIARGEGKSESDLDLLVVIKDLPERYSDRLRLFNEAVKGIEKLRLKLWEEKGLYPLIDPIILTPEDASTSHPFYLDMVDGCVLIFDRGKFMEKKLEKLRKRLKELEARKVLLADGKWYWELKPEVERGEVIEL